MPTGTVPTPSKTRREHFEAQLQSLQSDIAALSTKLSGGATASSIKTEQRGSRSKVTDEEEASGREQSFPITSVGEYGASSSDGGDTSDSPAPDGMSKKSIASAKLRGQVARLRKEMRAALRERDEASYRAEQLLRENEDLRRAVAEFQKIHGLYEHLKMDYDSLSLSLESSDRIRRQQKELIAILQQQLQRSDGPSDGSNYDLASGDNSSSRLSASKAPSAPPRSSSLLGAEASHIAEDSEYHPSNYQLSHSRAQSYNHKKISDTKEFIRDGFMEVNSVLSGSASSRRISSAPGLRRAPPPPHPAKQAAKSGSDSKDRLISKSRASKKKKLAPKGSKSENVSVAVTTDTQRKM